MNADDAFKILGEVAEKEKKETEALKNMSDTDFCAKMISYLGKELSEEQKGYGYGSYPVTISYNEIKTAFERDKLATEEALLYFRSYFYLEILNFCGCGSPISILDEVILPLLDEFDYGPYENFNHRTAEDDDISEPLIEFFLHYFDALDLTNHGSSVGGSWLEESGKMWREVLRRSKGIDV